MMREIRLLCMNRIIYGKSLESTVGLEGLINKNYCGKNLLIKHVAQNPFTSRH